MEGQEIIQVEATEIQTIDIQERANIDIQVATAKRYPRDIKRATQNAIAIVTTDSASASTCGYALPRGGKPITGPSVHLAKILAQQFGNIRAEAKVVQITDKQVVSRGVAWDLENNYAAAFEVRRSIIGSPKDGRPGKRYSDDMITVTGNAANAIAYRNAVFAIIPKSITDSVYNAAQHLITGDLSDEEKLIAKRTQVLNGFKDTYGMSEAEVLKIIGKETINQIKSEQIAVLIGTAQSLKDGDTTVSELMKGIRKGSDTVEKKELKVDTEEWNKTIQALTNGITIEQIRQKYMIDEDTESALFNEAMNKHKQVNNDKLF